MLTDDLLTDADVLALDVRATKDFGTDNAQLTAKRTVAVQSWMRPRVEARGYPVVKHRVRKAPEIGWQFTGGVYTDTTTALSDASTNDLNLATVFTTPGSDALYVGMLEPFRGVYAAFLDTVNSNSAVVSVAYWGGAWKALTLSDSTQISAGKTFGGSGRLTWALPTDWVSRPVHDAHAFYVRIMVNSPLTAGTALTQLLPILQSRLQFPGALYALGTLYGEGHASTRGDWRQKAEDYYARAQQELDLVLPILGDEFDMDSSEAVDPIEVNSVTTDALHLWERG